MKYLSSRSPCLGDLKEHKLFIFDSHLKLPNQFTPRSGSEFHNTQAVQPSCIAREERDRVRGSSREERDIKIPICIFIWTRKKPLLTKSLLCRVVLLGQPRSSLPPNTRDGRFLMTYSSPHPLLQMGLICNFYFIFFLLSF